MNLLTKNPLTTNPFNLKDTSAASRVGTAYTASTLSGQAGIVQLAGEAASRDLGLRSQGKSSQTTRSNIKTAASVNTRANAQLLRLRQHVNLGYGAVAQRAVQTGQRNRVDQQEKATLIQREPPAWFK